MRTTLDIDDDVLHAAKELARRERSSAGAVLSRLARGALTGGPAGSDRATPRSPKKPTAVGGFVPFPPRGHVVTNDKVNELRDIEGV